MAPSRSLPRRQWSSSNVRLEDLGRAQRGAAGDEDFPIAPGTSAQKIKVPIVPDDLAEGDETFTVLLSATGGVTIADASGLGTILDDD